MNEKQYQSMYRHICLSDEQKNRIWKNMRNTAGGAAAERKARFTLRGAVCICAVLMASGMTVLAVNSSYVERIAKAMGSFTGKDEVTQSQTDLYTEYGNSVEHRMMSGSGEVRIEAAFYDRGYLCLPFTLYPNTELEPGTDISSEPVFEGLLREMTGSVWYDPAEGEAVDEFSLYTRIDPVVEEDGSLTGSFVIVNTMEEGFAQGGVIRLIKRDYMKFGDTFGRALTEGEDTAGLSTFEVLVNGESVTYVEAVSGEELLAEIPLDNAQVPEMEVPTAGVSLPYGVRADKIVISPLALYLYGAGDNMHPADKMIYNIWVVLKDGSVMEWSGNWSSQRYREEHEDHEYGYRFSKAFSGVVELEDIAGVRITDRGEEICFIPVNGRRDSSAGAE